MNDFLIYLLKSLGLLLVFLGFYYFLLRTETDFVGNRKFLLAGLITSAVLPAIYFTRTIFIESQPQPYFFADTSITSVNVIPEETFFSIERILMIIYFAGVAVMVIRFMLQIISLLKIILSGTLVKNNRTKFIISSQKIAPFSFLHYIVYNPDLHSEEELHLILKHEKIHVTQWHSLDILIANMNLIYQWFNPFAWVYATSLQQNLEFIADSEAVKEVPCKKEYQKVLVKISVENLNLSLTNNFYQSLIKKRIIMLNKKNLTRNSSWKAGLIIPALLGFLLIFNVKTVAQIIEQKNEAVLAETMNVVATVTKNSTAEDLEIITENFQKQGLILKFTNVQRNQAGLITDISVELKNTDTNTSGSYSKSDPDGIKTFKIYSKDSGESGFSDSQPAKGHTYYVDTTSTNNNVRVYVTSKDRKSDDTIFYKGKDYNIGDGVYVVNGTVLNNNTMAQNIAPKNISSIQVLKGASATSLYGKAAKDGAVVIVTKDSDSLSRSGSGATTLSNNRIYYTSGSWVKKDAGLTTVRYVKIDSLKNGTNYFIRNQPATIKISSDGTDVSSSYSFGKSEAYIPSTQNNPPLFVVDGKKMGDSFQENDIDPENIKSITVLKRDNATKKYGNEGKNGVIEITLKDESIKATAGTFSVLNASTTDEGLKILKQQLQQQSNLKIDFRNIKRNSAGLIKEIKIIAKTSNEEIVGTFSETGNINDVYLGIINNKIYMSSNPPRK